MGQQNTLILKGLTVRYPGADSPALEDVSLTVPAGRRTAIVGRNGAGKSTLLKAAVGLLPIAAGDILIGGPYDSLNHKNYREIAYIPQRSEIDWTYPINCLDMVMMGQGGIQAWLPFVRSDVRKAARDCLNRLELSDFENRPIHALSGGQQQRVCLARALMQDASYYLLDEPFTGLDVRTIALAAQLFSELANDGRLVLAVHHDLSTLSDFFDDVVLINRRLIANGPVAKTLTDAARQAAYSL